MGEEAGVLEENLCDQVNFLVDYVESRDRADSASPDVMPGAPCLYVARTPCEIALRFAKAMESAKPNQRLRREYLTPQTLLSERDECVASKHTELRVDIYAGPTNGHGFRELCLSVAQRPMHSGRPFCKVTHRKTSFKHKAPDLLWAHVLSFLSMELHEGFVQANAHHAFRK